MSFFGYYQVLCKNGHLSRVDVYPYINFNEKIAEENGDILFRCDVCDELASWYNVVNCTDGIYEDYDADGNPIGERIDNFVELELKNPEKRCEHCNSIIEEETYYIPKGKGHGVNR